jgi:twinkle protein
MDDLKKQMMDVMSINGVDIERYENVDRVKKIRAAESYYDETIEFIDGKKVIEGYEMPWPWTVDKFKLRTGELTIWAGQNGDGKSLAVSQCMIAAMQQGAKVVLASLEMHPVETLSRMICQHCGIPKEKVGYGAVDEFMALARNKLWVYDEVGDVCSSDIEALARYSRIELEVDFLVIDSLMKCGTTEQDYAAEKKFINSLQNVAKQAGIGIHLVAHSRKPSQGVAAGKYEVKGSTAITDMADNVISVCRNRNKEKEAKKPNGNTDILEQPDTYFIVDKQRHHSWEGNLGLWFHESGKFTGR